MRRSLPRAVPTSATSSIEIPRNVGLGDQAKVDRKPAFSVQSQIGPSGSVLPGSGQTRDEVRRWVAAGSGPARSQWRSRMRRLLETRAPSRPLGAPRPEPDSRKRGADRPDGERAQPSPPGSGCRATAFIRAWTRSEAGRPTWRAAAQTRPGPGPARRPSLACTNSEMARGVSPTVSHPAKKVGTRRRRRRPPGARRGILVEPEDECCCQML